MIKPKVLDLPFKDELSESDSYVTSYPKNANWSWSMGKMDWFYLTPQPINFDAWGDVIDGDINVTKYEDEFKYGAVGNNDKMIKYIPEFKEDGIPILQMEFGRYCK